jgi:hypothetical protein
MYIYDTLEDADAHNLYNIEYSVSRLTTTHELYIREAKS